MANTPLDPNLFAQTITALEATVAATGATKTQRDVLMQALLAALNAQYPP